MQERTLAAMLAALLLIGCQGGDSDAANPTTSLVRLTDMPDGWELFTPSSSPETTDVCGRQASDQPDPVSSESIAFASDPVDGPIFGERIELWPTADAARARIDAFRELPVPCERNSSDGRWRTTAQPDPAYGDEATMVLVDRPEGNGSLNYEIRIRLDVRVIALVFNTYNADEELLDALIQIAIERARP